MSRGIQRRSDLFVATLVVAAAVSSASCVSASRGAGRSDPAGFAAVIDSLRVAARIPGLAVGVIEGGRVTLLRGYGVADVRTGVPVTEDTPFNIASVTKTMSGVVAMRLAARGQIDLDRRLTSFQDFVDFCKDAREGGGIFFRDFNCDTEPLTLRDALSMRVNGKRGERFLYNPIVYSWTSRPMREVSGVPFSTLTTELVLKPAAMTRSARIHRALPLSAELQAALARPHRVDSTGTIVPSADPPPQGDGAGAGVISTARDLTRFDLALDANTLISDSSKAEMWRPHRSSTGAILPYGIGWFVTDYEGERIVWHTGLWDGGYSALYVKVPARRLTLIVLANSDGLKWDNNLDEAALERSPFATAFLARYLRPARKAPGPAPN